MCNYHKNSFFFPFSFPNEHDVHEIEGIIAVTKTRFSKASHVQQNTFQTRPLESLFRFWDMDTPPPEHPVPGTLLLQFSGGPTLTVAVSLIAVYTALVPWSLSRHRGCNEC